MALDPALSKALAEAVAEAGQPAALGARLTAWLEALGEGQTAEDENLHFYEMAMAELTTQAGDED